MVRRPPNKDEKLAATLLHVREGGEWLIPEPLRSTGTPKEILAYVQFDHSTPVANGGTNAPQNLKPMSRGAHAIKTAKDVSRIAKGKRLARSARETQAILLAKVGKIADDEVMRRKRRNPLPCGRDSGWKKPLGKLNAVRRVK